jgi:hypothetical protein
MLLATEPSFEFLKLIQILCWILLPIAAVAFLLTVYLHYRRRKKASQPSTTSEEEFIKASPELLGYTNGDGDYIFFDQSSVITEYKKKLSYHNARYTALRHDFEKLETKYAELAGYAAATFMNPKLHDMENNHPQIPKSLQAEIDDISAQYKTEKEEFLKQLKQLNQVNKNLENEAQALQDQVNLQSANEDETLAILNRWKEDNTSLKLQVMEQRYVQDVLVEKKAQIEFLEAQLEHRIKNNHHAEQQRLDAIAELEEEKMQRLETNRKVDALKFEVLQKQEEADKLHMVLCGKEEELEASRQTINSKAEYITWLEKALAETKQQNELLHILTADNKNLVHSLRDQLSATEAANEQLSEKLETNKQLLQQLNKDIISTLSEGGGHSPVVVLRPEYASDELIVSGRVLGNV